MMEALTRTPAPTRSEDSRTTWEAEVVALGDCLGVRNLGLSPGSVPSAEQKRGMGTAGKGRV